MQEYKSLNLPVNDAYMQKFFRQILLNQKRIQQMPVEIQESVFILTAELFQKYFGERKIKQYKSLQKALKNLDFGQYTFYVKTH